MGFFYLHFLSTETMLAIATGSPCGLGMVLNTLYFVICENSGGCLFSCFIEDRQRNQVHTAS